MQASDLVASALRLVGALEHGETPSTEEAADGFAVLNMLVDGWNAEGIIYSLTTSSLALTQGRTSYLVGPLLPPPDIDGPRPLLIRAASAKNSAGTSGPVEIVDAKRWAEIPDRSETAQLVRKLYPTYSYPNAVLEVWPVPAAVQTLTLMAFHPLAQFVNPDQEISMAPGYLRALRYNLARDLSAEFGLPLPAEVAEIAKEAKAALVQLSAQALAGDTAPAAE